jgi:hypothetical protein
MLAAAASAAAATGVQWAPLYGGTTQPNGSQQPDGYLAVTKAQEQRWAGRLTAGDRAALQRVNLVQSGVLAVFLDGRPCASKLTVNTVTRTATTLTVTLHYTPPRIGMATCVRTSTAYVVLGLSRKTLGHPAPARVIVDAIARA